MNYKYIRIELKSTRPFGIKDIVAQIDANHLNKRGIEHKMLVLDSNYPEEHFILSTVNVNRELRVFIDEPEKWIKIREERLKETLTIKK